jgi:hypothetical protein
MDLLSFNKNIVKGNIQKNHNLDPCWNYIALWNNTLLEQVYKYFRGNKNINKVLRQICKNKHCVNPWHIIEVNKEDWVKMDLEEDQMWMDFV